MPVPYQFSADWFTWNVDIWRSIMDRYMIHPTKILEIGCFEGRCTTWMIENLLPAREGEIHCVDVWECGTDEALFDSNVGLALGTHPTLNLIKHKAKSEEILPMYLAQGHSSTFDFIYVDGSHDATDVLADLTMSFLLCRSGGLIVCDDYLWNFGDDPCSTPKLAIDAFVNCNAKRIKVLSAPLYQLFLLKT
jgi:predicted O-methyltransferase YrrM